MMCLIFFFDTLQDADGFLLWDFGKAGEVKQSQDQVMRKLERLKKRSARTGEEPRLEIGENEIRHPAPAAKY